MRLDYLLFDLTDEETGACSFDAMASALAPRLADVTHEIEAVLAWACGEFGAPSAGASEGEWGFELQAFEDDDTALEIEYDVERAQVSLSCGQSGRVTLALTITGSRAFAAAFMEAFPDPH